MSKFDVKNHPHRRVNPLTGDAILVSPHRAKRPWQGQVETKEHDDIPHYEHSCFLCPTNKRITGDVNPDYKTPYVFTNDFAALTENTPFFDSQQSSGAEFSVLSRGDSGDANGDTGDDELFILSSERGTSRVICYSPDHALTMPQLAQQDIVAIIEQWICQYQDLSKDYTWVQIFENKGAINGCSNPHPHGQVWANSTIPTIPSKEDQAQRRYLTKHNRKMLADYAARELADGERLVVENAHWIVVVPFWASWPFETLLLPKFAIARMEDLNTEQKSTLADILQQITIRYDNLFLSSFPYSMGWHGAPYAIEDCDHSMKDNDSAEDQSSHWQLHAHFYPPLLRSATVKKFMVGYEMLAETQRDLTPEQAAQRLRELSPIHYKNNK